MDAALDIFAVTAPGLEAPLADEARTAGFAVTGTSPGGVALRGDWEEVWRANLTLRGAARVLVRLGAFRVVHLAKLDKKARAFPWRTVLRPDVPLRVEVTSRRSRIYHAGAARQRFETALREELGASLSDDAPVVLKVRIEEDLCTISVDSSGESLHKRGHKPAVVKAPMRETMAALFLRQCGFAGDEPVLDPMCGSGTFVIEAAEIASGLLPGRDRGFAFEHLAGFHGQQFRKLKRAAETQAAREATMRFYGRDRDEGAIRASRANAERAGVTALTDFTPGAVADLQRPDGPPGLVMVNPPYGARIGNKGPLHGLHASLGERLRAGFSGWRVGLVTSEPALARATGLPFLPPGPVVAHGGLKVRLYQTGALP